MSARREEGELSIAFHGAAGTVTGSRTVVRFGKRNILVDCGLFQGTRELRERNWERQAFRPNSIDAVLLTHAHLDHIGYVPKLVRDGYRGYIYSTAPTAELARVLLLDSAKLQEEDAEYLNRKGYSRHKPALPLYTEEDALRSLHRFRSVPYHRWLKLGGGIRARFYNAGHILGSAVIVLELEAERRRARVAFSGDLGRYDMPLHTDPEPLPACEALVLESTYGDRSHSAAPFVDQVRGPMLQTLRQGGTVLIPSFAMARTQVVALMLRELMRDGQLPQVPIHVDSPMATEVTRIYDRYMGSEFLDEEIPGSEARSLFGNHVRFHSTVAESQALNNLSGPRIIIASSGMLQGGRILHHLKRLLPERRNLVALVGYQAEGTRGRQLIEGARSLRIHGRDVPVAARVIQFEGLSAHADQQETMRWLRSGANPPHTIFVNHGEASAAKALARRIKHELGIEPYVPGLDQEYALDYLLG